MVSSKWATIEAVVHRLRAAVCAWSDEQADARHAAFRPTAAGLLAAGPLAATLGGKTAPRESPLPPANGNFLGRDASSSAESRRGGRNTGFHIPRGERA